jgi:hypothetical protein
MQLGQILRRQPTLYDDRSGRLKIVLRHNSMINKAAALVTSTSPAKITNYHCRTSCRHYPNRGHR